MAGILLGYDVESFAIGEGLARIPNHGLTTALDPASCARGLEVITSVHEDLGVSGTLFVCGKTLLHNIPAVRDAAARSCFDVQQHTYSHILFKPDDWRGGGFIESTPEALAHEVTATSQLLAEHVGVDCIGLRTPHGYYEGLADRPGSLRMIADAGIKYVSSWGRNEQGGNPTPFEHQPYWYDAQGFPNVLEIPFQGWLDGTWFEEFGPEDADGYLAVLKSTVDIVERGDLIYGACFHDWAIVHYNEGEKRWLRRFIEYALERQVPVMSYTEYYLQQRAARVATR